MTTYEYITGSRRGYIPVANRGKQSGRHPVPDSLKGLRGNYRKAMAYMMEHGASYYTIAYYQGVPYKGYSNQYYYTVYTGYTDKEV